MPCYNGSVRRSNATGNKNSKCEVYTSPKLKELLKAMPAREATLYGKGSVAHTEATPSAYTLTACQGEYHIPVGNKSVLLQSKPFTPTFSPKLGETLFWCTACRNWIVTERLFVPKPNELPKYVKPYFGVNGINGNAFAEPRHR